jgi:hypothetical protein
MAVTAVINLWAQIEYNYAWLVALIAKGRSPHNHDDIQRRD